MSSLFCIRLNSRTIVLKPRTPQAWVFKTPDGLGSLLEEDDAGCGAVHAKAWEPVPVWTRSAAVLIEAPGGRVPLHIYVTSRDAVPYIDVECGRGLPVPMAHGEAHEVALVGMTAVIVDEARCECTCVCARTSNNRTVSSLGQPHRGWAGRAVCGRHRHRRRCRRIRATTSRPRASGRRGEADR